MNRESPRTPNQPVETVVSGSFRKHMEAIGTILENFQRADIKVLAPASKDVIDPHMEFIILATDDQEKPPPQTRNGFHARDTESAFSLHRQY